MPATDMQWRARKIAMQASRLADQARPITNSAAKTAKRGAGNAATWAISPVSGARAWMPSGRPRQRLGQETVSPWLSTAAATRGGDPSSGPVAGRR
jgi:hypothetical protein